MNVRFGLFAVVHRDITRMSASEGYPAVRWTIFQNLNLNFRSHPEQSFKMAGIPQFQGLQTAKSGYSPAADSLPDRVGSNRKY